MKTFANSPQWKDGQPKKQSVHRNGNCLVGSELWENNMLLQEICCRERYIAGGDMLLEGICYWRGYLKEVSSQRRYLAKGGIQPKEVSSQRRYLAKGETYHYFLYFVPL